jgi:hypothetical protein
MFNALRLVMRLCILFCLLWQIITGKSDQINLVAYRTAILLVEKIEHITLSNAKINGEDNRKRGES